MAISLIPNLSAVADAYDGFVLDLWGVVHDGHKPYPDAVACLTALKAAGKRVVLLSNAPRRAEGVSDAMVAMGIPRDLYDGAVTSGELTWQAIKTKSDPWHARLGKRFIHIGPERDQGLWAGLGLEWHKEVEAAQFVLNTGPWRDEETLADFEAVLQDCANLRLPMICANPDLEVIRGGARLICAGTLAARYAELGGDVAYHGKPFPAAYDACLGLMALADRSRILAVGDSLITDIKGAVGAGIDSALVTSGIHAEELGLAYGEHPDPARLEAACLRLGAMPKLALPAFRWN
ncbi:MAG TPA: TIGR01459 family HAD-type hydrolase [Alphaproteobacteria bacterium]|jgi:HAD superfamily hydrolase (TIGR01459 family)